MSKKVVEFPERSVINAEAVEWLIRLDNSEPPTEEERLILKEWVQRSPVHEEELRKVTHLWGSFNVLTELSVPLGKVEYSSTRSIRVKNSDCFHDRPAAAVALATVVVAAFVYMGMLLFPKEDPLISTNGLYATAVGQQETALLADGSTVLLNTNTQISVDYGRHYREVQLLQGEALFTVAKNATRPFRVQAGNGRVEAIGTAFAVRLKEDAVDVMVKEGRVILASESSRSLGGSADSSAATAVMIGGNDKISTDAESAVIDKITTLGVLSAGQTATVPRQFSGFTPSEQEEEVAVIKTIDPQVLDKQLSWSSGVLSFTGDPLETVVKEISRYTAITIEISDPILNAIAVGGRFPVGETELVLTALEKNFGVRVTRLSRNHVVLSPGQI